MPHERVWDQNPKLVEEAEALRRRHHSDGSGETRPKIELIRFEDMLPRLDGRPLVRGLLERYQISVIYGGSGCGKTFFALDMALHVAAGLPWFNRKVDQGAVVYVAVEAGLGITNRVAAWRAAHELEHGNVQFAVVPSPINLCGVGTGDLYRLIEAIKKEGFERIALVVIDTVSRALAGGNENASDVMGEFVKSLDRLRDELRCHVAAIHHTGKDQSRGSRGHSLLRCAVDTEIEVERDPAMGISVARVTKQRDGATDSRIGFRLQRVELGLDPDGEPVTSCVVKAVDNLPNELAAKKRLPPSQIRALELLKEGINKEGKIPPACDHFPAKTRCVNEDLWRRYFCAGQVGESCQPGSAQRSFKRASQALLSRRRVGSWNQWVWLIS